MSIKKLKQKTATALVAVMTASSIFTAFAGTIGTPSSSTRSITVTFSAGEGGYWESEDVASDSEATATPSTSSTAARATEKTYTLTKTFKNLESDENGKFIMLSSGAEELDGAEWNDVKNDDESKKYAWYYDDAEVGAVPVYDNTEIYSNVTLSAKWYDPAQVVVEEAIKEIGAPVATNLGNATLIIEAVKEEEKLDHDALEAHEQVKAALETAKLELNKEIPLYPLEIKVEGNRGTNEPVTITMDLPEDFETVAEAMVEDADSSEKIKVIHIGDDEVEILPVDVRKEDLGSNATWKMTFSTMSFSPFYIAVLKDAPQTEEMVKVKLRNVKNGYVQAYSEGPDENGDRVRINLPIGEEVEIPKGTKLTFWPEGYRPDEGTKKGVFESLSFLDSEGKVIVENGNEQKYTKKDIEGSALFVRVNWDCEIVGEFSVGDIEDEEYTRAPFIIILEPSVFGNKIDSYSGTPEVLQWDESKGRYQHFTGWTLRKPTEDELEQNGNGGNAWRLFDYKDGKLTSTKELDIGYYYLPFVINYQGEDYLFGNGHPNYGVGIDVGAYMELMYGYIMYNGKYSIYENGTIRMGDTPNFAYTEGDAWGKIDQNMFYVYEQNLMYGYEQNGWQTVKGEPYTADTKLETRYEDGYYFEAVARFTRTVDGKEEVYKVEAIGDPEIVPETPTPTNPTNPSKPGSSSGGSGGGGGSSSGSRSAGTNSYAMTGSWIGDAVNGWKFLKSNGEYAANAWGWINGQYYYFDAAGNMVTGWHFINGYWYYLNPAEGSLQGAMLTGVIFDPDYNAYFYADASGAMVTGWYQVGANWYYFNPISDGRQGALLADTYIDGYYVGADGAWIPAN